MNNNVDGEVMVMEPQSFEEIPTVIQALWQRKSVLLNLTMMAPQVAQRAVDFIAGGVFALDGEQARVAENIFLFTPNCVSVSKQSEVVDQLPQSQVHYAYPEAYTSRRTSSTMPLAM